jgi:hypothetical protein
MTWCLWNSWGDAWQVGEVVSATEKTAQVIDRGSRYASDKPRRKDLSGIVMFPTREAAEAAKRKIDDLNNREIDTCRQYTAKRKAILDAARNAGKDA